MRLLLSINNLGIGGVQTYLIHLANGLSQKHEVWVYVHYPYASSRMNTNRIDNFIHLISPSSLSVQDYLFWKVNSVLNKLGRPAHAWEDFKNRHFSAVLKQNRIEAIISFDRYSDYIVTSLKNKHKLPVLLSLHGNYDIDPENPWKEEDINQFTRVFRQVDGIVYKTDENIRLIREMGPFPNILVMRKILHGFTNHTGLRPLEIIKSEFGIGEKAFVFSMMARGDPTKGWQEALDAFVQLKQSIKPADQDVVFLCLGSGQYMEELKKKFSKAQNIIFLDGNTNSQELAYVTDVGVLPTYFKTENYSYAVIEYLYASKPVIATIHGKIPESLSVGNDFAGILISKGPDGKAELSQITAAMLQLLQSPESYDHLKILAEKAFKKFSSERSVAAYEEVFSIVLNNGSA